MKSAASSFNLGRNKRVFPRIPSRRDMRRSESAPTLAPVWEPNEGEEGHEAVAQRPHAKELGVEGQIC